MAQKRWIHVIDCFKWVKLHVSPTPQWLIRVFIVSVRSHPNFEIPGISEFPLSFSLCVSLFISKTACVEEKKKTIKWKASFSIILHIYCILTPSLQFGVELDPSLLSCEKQIPNLPTARDLRRSSNHTEVSISAPFRTCDFYSAAECPISTSTWLQRHPGGAVSN